MWVTIVIARSTNKSATATTITNGPKYLGLCSYNSSLELEPIFHTDSSNKHTKYKSKRKAIKLTQTDK